METMNGCECGCEAAVDLPISGLSMKVDPSALGCLSLEEIQEMIDRSLALNPGGGMVPDLKLGEEILWPGRYKGKQIYAKLIDFGNLPNNTSKSVAHGIADMEWFCFSHDHSRVIHSSGSVSPLAYPWTGSAPIAPGLNKTTVTLYTAKDYRKSIAEICILFTRESDPVIG